MFRAVHRCSTKYNAPYDWEKPYGMEASSSHTQVAWLWRHSCRCAKNNGQRTTVQRCHFIQRNMRRAGALGFNFYPDRIFAHFLFINPNCEGGSPRPHFLRFFAFSKLTPSPLRGEWKFRHFWSHWIAYIWVFPDNMSVAQWEKMDFHEAHCLSSYLRPRIRTFIALQLLNFEDCWRWWILFTCHIIIIQFFFGLSQCTCVNTWKTWITQIFRCTQV